MLIKNKIYTAVIDGYSSDGSGVARIEGQVVFVKNAVRGETCLIKILKAGKTVAYAKIEEILSPSEHRVEGMCPVFGKCGGCNLMHMDYEEELFMKRQKVQDALKRIGGLDLEISGIIGADTCDNYRNKVIYAVDEKDGHSQTGFFRQHSHDVVGVERCRIQPDVFDRAAKAVRSWMDENKIPVYDEGTMQGAIRNVFCRYAFMTKTAQVTIVSAVENIPETQKLIDSILHACPETASIILNVNETTGNTVLTGKFVTLWGKDYIEDELCGLKFILSPLSFYQINHTQAEKLYEKVLEYANADGVETVLDLYCGTGTITLCLAGKAKHVIGAEIVETAVKDARENAVRNNIKNVEFICADAYETAQKLKNDGLIPDVVVVDPPRKGLDSEVLETIAQMKPERVVYVSCDPATLARDLKRFDELNYKAIRAEALDMFPKTAHVETVVLMSRADK